jgi:hypothetical protein
MKCIAVPDSRRTCRAPLIFCPCLGTSCQAFPRMPPLSLTNCTNDSLKCSIVHKDAQPVSLGAGLTSILDSKKSRKITIRDEVQKQEVTVKIPRRLNKKALRHLRTPNSPWKVYVYAATDAGDGKMQAKAEPKAIVLPTRNTKAFLSLLPDHRQLGDLCLPGACDSNAKLMDSDF